MGKQFLDYDGLKTYHKNVKAQFDDHATKINTKQNKLISGTNIKTINSNSLLGSGNLAIEELGMEPLTELDILEVLGETEILQSVDTE